MTMKLILLRLEVADDRTPKQRTEDFGPHLQRLLSRLSPDFLALGPRSDKLTMQSYFIRSQANSQGIAKEIHGLPHMHVRDQILVLELGSDHGEVRQNALLHQLRG